MRAMLQRLTSHVDTPGPDAPETDWKQWMDSNEVDDRIAGWIVSTLAGAPPDRRDLEVARKRLLANMPWRDTVGPRYGALVEAVELLLKTTSLSPSRADNDRKSK